jgi:hypothetical protein
MKVPAALHEVLGEDPRASDVVLILLFGGLVGSVLATSELMAALPLWRGALATALAADIGAGLVSNFSDSTNNFYATRPKHRWAFIACHVHVLLLAWLLGVDGWAALFVWALTLASASIVNLLAGHPAQRLVGGALLGVALLLLPRTALPSPLVAINTLFFVKVAYAFAVDHRAGADLPGRAARQKD